jgi:two-component system chemotaxis response regulator CheY
MSESLRPSSTLTALVIEDDETCVDQAGAVLRRLGLDVEHATDGLDGLQRCRAKRYDLIICDVRMPRLSGLSFLSNLPRTGNATTRVVMLSALDDAAIRRQALASGASAYLVKPMTTDALIDAIALPSIRRAND